MEHSEGVQLLQRSVVSNEAISIAPSDMQGVAGWVLGLFRVWRGQRETRRRQLRLVEMLPLGGKRQLMLVTCAGESFLVGAGADSVETIVRLNVDTLSAQATSLDEPCR